MPVSNGVNVVGSWDLSQDVSVNTVCLCRHRTKGLIIYTVGSGRDKDKLAVIFTNQGCLSDDDDAAGCDVEGHDDDDHHGRAGQGYWHQHYNEYFSA